MLESELQSQVIELLESLGYWVVRVIHSPTSGVMDLICCSPTGKFVGIELKVGNNTPSDLQALAISEVLKRGGYAFVAWSIEDVKEGLKKGRRDDGHEQQLGKCKIML